MEMNIYGAAIVQLVLGPETMEGNQQTVVRLMAPVDDTREAPTLNTQVGDTVSTETHFLESQTVVALIPALRGEAGRSL